MQHNQIAVGERVLYRYSPAGKAIIGVVIESWGNGSIAVRTNVKGSNYNLLVMYRKAESWQVLADNSSLHKRFGRQGGILPWRMISVPPAIKAKLARI